MSKFVLLVSCLTAVLFGLAIADEAKPLSVKVIDVQEDSATFEVSGSDELMGSPVASIKANYKSQSRMRRNRTSKPDVIVKNYNSVLLSDHQFSQTVQIKNLEAGRLYHFSFAAVNQAGQTGPDSVNTPVYMLPATPDVEVHHEQDAKLIIKWGGEAIGHEDFYVVTYEKADKPGCNVTLSVSTCFGSQYSFDDLQRHTTYKFTIMSHNPSGYSKPALIIYPID